MNHRFVEANGLRFHCVTAGEGPLVLLLHGFPEFWYSWRHQIPALAAAGFMAVAPDLRGYNGLDYPRGRRQIIVVDNMSTDRTREVIERYPVTCLEERTRQSSYAARNRGIAVATGEILAFADADCRPRPGWLRAYAAHFGRHQDDYVSGPVDLVIDGPVGPCALYDKGKFFLQERYFRSGWGATANLAVRRALMDRVEAFDGSVISGGDVEFCLRA